MTCVAASIFGLDNCPEGAVTPGVATTRVLVERSAPTGPPGISSLVPAVASPNSVLAVTGYALGLEDSNSVRVLFRRDTLERTGRVSSSGRALSRDANNEFQYMDVLVPTDLSPGPWQLVIDANGRRSDPVAVEITEQADLQLTGISPVRPHPAQGVCSQQQHLPELVIMYNSRMHTAGDGAWRQGCPHLASA
jgi:hypothetical protein